MPLHVDVKRKLTTRSDRVKSLDLHPSEPWLLVTLYNGSIHVWDIEQQQLIKTVDVCSMPVRSGKFISRKFWMVFGSDDMMIRIYNYNTTERIKEFEAHTDYIRSILVHPTHPYIITSSDDMSIKLWDWENNWKMIMSFEGHIHYVMNLAINPKDNNTFASASLDKTIKVWKIGSSRPNFSLEGHTKGVNFVDYYSLGDKPYLASGSDDRTIMIWDFQTKTCIQTLTAHSHNISFVVFHPQLPLLLSGSEDGTVNLWHSGTYRLETTLSYGMERTWCAVTGKGTYQNMVAIGYDEGAIAISLGKDEPSISMDKNGKIICAQHCEIFQANIKSILSTMDESSIKDGERIPTNLKELGTCDMYPQSIQHNFNGRFVVICGDGEYVIHTAMALRNKSYGQAFEFIWSPLDANSYAIRDSNQQIKIFNNFKEFKSIHTEFSIDSIFSGALIGVKGVQGLSFYDWTTCTFIRRIDINPENIYWNDSGTLVAICTKDEFFILRYNSELIGQQLNAQAIDDEIEEAFEMIHNGQIQDCVIKGIWYGDAFIFQNNSNKLRYFVGGEVMTLTQHDKGVILIGYMAKENRLFFVDNKLQLLSYTLYQSILEYEAAIIEEEFHKADSILPTIPEEQLKNLAIFLEKQGHNELALEVTNDPDHKFDLSLKLGNLQLAYSLLHSEAQQDGLEEKWKHLAELACKKSDFELAQNCLLNCKDFPSLLVLASCSGNVPMMQQISKIADQEKYKNLHFLASFLMGNLDECLNALIKSERYAEAAFFSRAYVPSRCSEVVKKWKTVLKNESNNQSDIKVFESIADPVGNEDLFPEFEKSLKAEKCIKVSAANRLRMSPVNYPKIERGWENDIENSDILSAPIPEPIPSPTEPMLPVNKFEENFKKLSQSSISSIKKSTSSMNSVDIIVDQNVSEIDKMMTRVGISQHSNYPPIEIENSLKSSTEKSLKSSSEREREDLESSKEGLILLDKEKEEKNEEEEKNGEEEENVEEENDNTNNQDCGFNLNFNWSDDDDNYE